MGCGRLGFEAVGPDVGPDGGAASDPDPDLDADDGMDADPFAASPERITPGSRWVFVTSTTYTGDLGGVAGADAKCQEGAAAAGLSGPFFAWIATSELDAPAARFARSAEPYVLLDGTVIAEDWDDLTDQSIHAALARDEFGEQAAAPRFWSNANWKGLAHSALSLCQGWTAVAGERGYSGNTTTTNPSWANDINLPCAHEFSLACFEQ